MFCSPYDHTLAHEGPAAVFLFDPSNELRHNVTWTRDAYGRQPGPHTHGWVWLLLRDRGTGFVQLALVTSSTLIPEHPRLDVRSYQSREAAQSARGEFGAPPICPEAW